MSERTITVLAQIYNLAQDLRYRMRDIGTAPFGQQHEATLRADYAWKTLRTALETAALHEPDRVEVAAVQAEFMAARALADVLILRDIGICQVCGERLGPLALAIEHRADCALWRYQAAREANGR